MAEEQGGNTARDARFLVSILLVYVARGDGHIDSAETDRMIDFLRGHFNSTGAEAMGLLSDAVRTFTDLDELQGELRAISDGLTESERSEILDMLLQVVLSDGEIAEGEKDSIRIAAGILGLNSGSVQDRIAALVG